MKAVVISGSGKCSVQNIAFQPLKNYEIRIQVKASCVCGSDLKNFKKPVVAPQIPGHEFSGTVVERGPQTSGQIEVGERVTAFPMMGCMKCDACASGRFRDCDQKLALGFQLPGSFAEFVVVDERFVIPLNPSITFEQGALVEHLCCGHRLAKEVQAMQPHRGSHIVIIGDGPIALADVQALQTCGYSNITLIGKHTFRMELASRLNTKNVINCWDGSLGQIDACIYAALAPDTMESVIDSMNQNAIIFPQTSLSNKYPQFKLGRAFAYSLNDFYEVMKLIERGAYKTDGLITRRVSLDDFPKCFPTLFQKNDQFKTVLIP